MDWDAVSAVGELVGAAAVVISLVYLATQVRQSTAVARSSMRHSVTQSVMVGGKMLAESDVIAGLILRRLNGETLAPDEHLRLMGMCFTTTRNWENIHYQFRSGMLTRVEWMAFRENLRALFQSPIWQEYWEGEHDIYTPAFREEVGHLLREIDAGKKAAVGSALLTEASGPA